MTMTRTIHSRTEMSQRYYDTLVRMLHSQAYRELAAATVFAEALLLVPTLAFKKKVLGHIDEEMEHFEACCHLHDRIGAGDLDAHCSKLLRELRPIPHIESFLELGVAQMLYDRASAFQLREYENSSFDPYCQVVGKILDEEEGHESFGAEIVIQHCRDEVQRAVAQGLFEKWLAVSLKSFGRPHTEASRYAISVGLKTRDSSAVAQDYIDSLKPTMRVCGIAFPTRARLAELGVETSPGIDLGL